jgi:protein-S-isoprenylcysteine O-methyltransferase Ste14
MNQKAIREWLTLSLVGLVLGVGAALLEGWLDVPHDWFQTGMVVVFGIAIVVLIWAGFTTLRGLFDDDDWP